MTPCAKFSFSWHCKRRVCQAGRERDLCSALRFSWQLRHDNYNQGSLSVGNQASTLSGKVAVFEFRFAAPSEQENSITQVKIFLVWTDGAAVVGFLKVLFAGRPLVSLNLVSQPTCVWFCCCRPFMFSFVYLHWLQRASVHTAPVLVGFTFFEQTAGIDFDGNTISGSTVECLSYSLCPWIFIIETSSSENQTYIQRQDDEKWLNL